MYLLKNDMEKIDETLYKEFVIQEQLCDAHNVGEAFKLMQEAKLEKERKVYATYNKRLLKDMNEAHRWNYGEQGMPIVWKKEWNYTEPK